MSDREYLEKYYEGDIKEAEKLLFEGVPVQYIVGNVDFYNCKILVDNSVLIPRFETELLVDKTVSLIKKYKLENSKALDLCTGSGCIAIALKKSIPSLSVDAIDYSQKALNKAKENSILNKVDINYSLLNILEDEITGNYNIIISNPPYVSKDEKVDDKTKYEPQDAIFADNNGLEFYEYIAMKSKNVITEKSIIALEIGYKQGKDVVNIFRKYYPDSNIRIEKDYGNFDRFVFVINNCE